LKSYYLAKTALKVSILRIKAYQQARVFAAQLLNGVDPATLQGVMNQLDLIWSIPLSFPLPVLAATDAGVGDSIGKFNAGLGGGDGSFTSTIVGEGGNKININSIIAAKASATAQLQNPSAANATNNQSSANNSSSGSSGATTPSAAPALTPEAALDNFKGFIDQMLLQKQQEDSGFADFFRDLKTLDVSEQIQGWADPTVMRQSSIDKIPPKRAPFYAIEELHFLSLVDDDVYNLLKDNFTTQSPEGININSANANTFCLVFRNLTQQDCQKLVSVRDQQPSGPGFTSLADFYTALANFPGYRGKSANDIQQEIGGISLKAVLTNTEFKIVVQANVGQSATNIDAFVSIDPAPTGQKSAASAPAPGASLTNGTDPTAGVSSGLTLTIMRIY
jgi:hypothetical protein